MIMAKTFINELKVLHAKRELAELDVQVNKFIQENNVKEVVSVSDACTAGEGDTIGIIML
ncbi:MAG: hypothetical protein AMK71_03595 [Nitrospira bacterium SG8_35_4]|nr:MAG: hypothetical protein AMK71_03595 [Nitrospira bacterium SG8_35_4]